jgi:hypothetical protein
MSAFGSIAAWSDAQQNVCDAVASHYATLVSFPSRRMGMSSVIAWIASVRASRGEIVLIVEPNLDTYNAMCRALAAHIPAAVVHNCSENACFIELGTHGGIIECKFITASGDLSEEGACSPDCVLFDNADLMSPYAYINVVSRIPHKLEKLRFLAAGVKGPLAKPTGGLMDMLGEFPDQRMHKITLLPPPEPTAQEKK